MTRAGIQSMSKEKNYVMRDQNSHFELWQLISEMCLQTIVIKRSDEEKMPNFMVCIALHLPMA